MFKMCSLLSMPKWLTFIQFNNLQLQKAYGCVFTGGVLAITRFSLRRGREAGCLAWGLDQLACGARAEMSWLFLLYS